jgi:hypothetical protein
MGAMTENQLIQPLLDGPLDIVGDIHGELGALQDLLGHLGYSASGGHRQGRHLVFVGDLCDRGQDSPGVIAFVQKLVARRLAQCLLGNHELSVLRGARKEGNGWFYNPNHDHAAGKFLRSRPAEPSARPGILDFFAGLPLILERPDLRLVHASWHGSAIEQLRAADAAGERVLKLYKRCAAQASALVVASEHAELGRREFDTYRELLTNPAVAVPLLQHHGKVDEIYQMQNPVRVVTSGPEFLATAPFFASGKWRMLERVKWWNTYTDDIPVIIGHYWRWPTAAARERYSRGERDLFDGAALQEWHGARRNVFCVDLGVGARYKERDEGRDAHFETRLAAVRWPECDMVCDDGARRKMEPRQP